MANQYIVQRESFEILGKSEKPTGDIPFDSKPHGRYFTVTTETLDEAKKIVTTLEATNYAKESIDMVDLLTIINNMKRSHGSADISPAMLKALIKAKLEENV